MKKLRNLLAMAFNLMAMAFNLLAMASNLLAMAFNLPMALPSRASQNAARNFEFRATLSTYGKVDKNAWRRLTKDLLGIAGFHYVSLTRLASSSISSSWSAR